MHRHLVAAALLCLASASAEAADLGGGAMESCACDSGMVVVYDSEPGVVVRNWKAGMRIHCECGPAAGHVVYRRIAAPHLPRYESLRDPWRR